MFKKFAVVVCMLVASLSGARAFVAPSRAPVAVARPAAPMRMSLAQDAQKVVAAASTALLTAAPAFATEGTGEAFGIDSNIELYVPLALLVGINVIYFQWAKTQPEGDFFSEYDQRRK